MNDADDCTSFTDTYTFDAFSNRLTLTHEASGTADDSVTTYGYDANDRLLQERHDQTGTAQDTFTRYSYGNTLAAAGLTSAADAYTARLFGGGEFDPRTGLNYNDARYVDLRTGTFPSADPYRGDTFDPQSLHKYLYANANPIANTDPSGNFISFLLSNWAYGTYVHEEIGDDFVMRGPGRVSNRAINTILGTHSPFGSDRPDLVEKPRGKSSGHVFEIKARGPYNTGLVTGAAQLSWYLYLLNTLDPSARSWIPGEITNYDPPHVININSTTVALVSPPVAGVILYQVVEIRLTTIELLGIGMLSSYYQAGITARLGQSELLASFGVV